MRNSFLPRLILLFPCMIMIFMPWAMNLEVRNISLNIVDNDHSVISGRLVDKIAASTYFRLTALPDSYDAALRNVESGDADVILEIPHHFERNCTSGNTAHVLIAVNAVNGTKGGLGSAYLSNIIRDYASEVVSSSAFSPVTPLCLSFLTVFSWMRPAPAWASSAKSRMYGTKKPTITCIIRI